MAYTVYAKDMAHIHFVVLHTAFHFYAFSSPSLSLTHMLVRSAFATKYIFCKRRANVVSFSVYVCAGEGVV